MKLILGEYRLCGGDPSTTQLAPVIIGNMALELSKSVSHCSWQVHCNELPPSDLFKRKRKLKKWYEQYPIVIITGNIIII